MAIDTQFYPRLYSQFVDALVPALAGSRYAAKDFTKTAREKGETVTVQIDRKPDPDRVETYTDQLLPTSSDGPDPKFFNIKLSEYFARKVQIGAKEYHQVTDGVLPSEFRTAALDMALHINRAVMRMYKQTPYNVVSATPFDGNDLDDLKAINAQASKQYMPTMGANGMGRVMLLSADTHAEAQANERLGDYNRTGLPPGMDRIEAFRQRNYDWVLDQQVQKSPAGTRKNGGTFLVNGVVAEGDTKITIDGIAGTLKDGDILATNSEADGGLIGTVKGDVAAGAGGTAVELYHGSLTAVADNKQLKVIGGAGKTENIVMAPGAIQMAFRMPILPQDKQGVDYMASRDKVSGVPVLMRIWKGPGVHQVIFIVLYGLGVPQPGQMLRLISNA